MCDIVISELKKSFGSHIIFEHLCATFKQRETTCIMGPSGSGKTTLLHILMGLVPYDSGTITGIPFLKSVVFQEDRLCQEFNALRNVQFACAKTTSDEEIISHLAQVNLVENLKKPVKEFSGGMKRRVALVRAILAPGDILFLDEPLKGLDEHTKEIVIQYIKKNVKSRTVLMVTHDIEESKALNANRFML